MSKKMCVGRCTDVKNNNTEKQINKRQNANINFKMFMFCVHSYLFIHSQVGPHRHFVLLRRPNKVAVHPWSTLDGTRQ